MTYRAPKGTDDVLPPDSAVWVEAERTFLDLAERYGYGLVLTPLFESTELFSRGIGEDTEVVEKQMYTFTDKGDRSVTLRPEATASVVRAIIQAGGVIGTFKGSYWGPMFRYERPQKGRRRQFTQAGIEYLGENASGADVEVIEFGYRYLQALGVPDIEVQLNSIGDAGDRADYRSELIGFLETRRRDLTEDAVRRMYENPMRVLDSKADAAAVAGAPTPIEHLSDETAEHFAEVRAGLEAAGIPYRIAPTLVRGLDYYNRTVWEYVPLGFDAAQSSVGGGGRYDPLFEMLGGKPTAAVGLAMGLDRILLARGEIAPDPALDAFIVVADPERRPVATELVRRLRDERFRVDMVVGNRSVTAQFKAADRAGAAGVLVVGEEWDEGRVTARDLATGAQRLVVVEEIEIWLRR
ncbi:MAG: histidine--tRNA ligase, partial [Actinomycetota bacterium]|nr:histidine--tRNA ligase [Actinomycetota bacterium]